MYECLILKIKSILMSWGFVGYIVILDLIYCTLIR